jgi:hypothetical protein
LILAYLIISQPSIYKNLQKNWIVKELILFIT